VGRVSGAGPTRDAIRLYDTTLRDGTQREGLTLSVDDKLRLAEELDRLGVHYVEGGWPGSNPKDAEFFERARGLRLGHARLAAFGSTRHPGSRVEDDANIRALVDAATPVVTVVGKASALHVSHVLETTPEENLRMIADSIALFKRLGREAIFDAEHFFDGFRLDAEFALATLRAAAEAGADCVVLCDTNGGSLPDDVAAIVREVRARVDAPLGIHTHDDGGLALANALAAVAAGCTQVQGTVNGYGERCGNLDLVPLIANLQLKLGYTCIPEEQLRRLTEVSHLFAEVANLAPDTHAPFVGRSAFAHKGGIHVAAVHKLAASYEHVEPAAVGNGTRVVISELAGRRNVRIRAEALGVPLHGLDRVVLARIKELESRGLQFEAADGSFEMLVRRASPGYRAPFELLDFTVIVAKQGTETPRVQATTKLRIGEVTTHTAADGHGPVDALDGAIRKALLPHFPRLAEVHLVDYKVRIVDAHLGTAAKPRVLIESARGEERWSTVGCSENIIEASWQALWDSLELPCCATSTPRRPRRPTPNRPASPCGAWLFPSPHPSKPETMPSPRTLFQKIWDGHAVRRETPQTPAVLYVDLHLVHEVTSPQAFAELRERGLRVRRPDRTLATMDHSTPTTPRGTDGRIPVGDAQAAAQLAQLERNCTDFGIPLFALGSDRRASCT
jgi:2-isopropylmalate synthase